jgi:hypothetical protein
MKRRKFTAAQRRAVDAYVADAAKTLRLSDWTITVDWATQPEEGVLADCTAPWGQRRATIRFSDELHTMGEWELRQTVVHELMHCVLHPVSDMVETTVSEGMKKPAARVLAAAVDLAVETAVDHLADIVSPMMPPIPVELPDPARPVTPLVKKPAAGALKRPAKKS